MTDQPLIQLGCEGDREKVVVCVCGGRRYQDVNRVHSVLDHKSTEAEWAMIVEGGATGADEHARSWAMARYVPCLTVPAMWNRGKMAGPIRNAWIVQVVQPDLVIAFPGGRGTADMVRRAQDAEIQVVCIDWISDHLVKAMTN